jgi:predicted phosphoribosyltransferase
MWTTFRDRREAGQLLAEALIPYASSPGLIVLALPRGGVPVAYEVARRFGVPLDICVVRKLGVPGHEELAMGAIASGGVEVLSAWTVRELGITQQQVQRVVEREREELERRERAYRGDRPAVEVRDRTVILVDDGLATGASMRAAVVALRERKPAAIIVAVPVAPASTCEDLKHVADACVCLHTPEPFYGVGQWYIDFGQTSDDEVRALLGARSRPVMVTHGSPVATDRAV